MAWFKLLTGCAIFSSHVGAKTHESMANALSRTYQPLSRTTTFYIFCSYMDVSLMVPIDGTCTAIPYILDVTLQDGRHWTIYAAKLEYTVLPVLSRHNPIFEIFLSGATSKMFAIFNILELCQCNLSCVLW